MSICSAGAPLRVFEVVAIPIRIVINKAGEHNPHGLMYVLKDKEQGVRDAVDNNPDMPVEEVQPLVLRANVGDCIEINFENKLVFAASMHIQGVQYDVLNSDGAVAGFNPSSVAQPGQVIRYRWFADREGIFMFNDLGNPVSDETGSNLHGLFGALIVEPLGATWTDPVTGAPMDSGLYADIHVPDQPDFREYAIFMHDEMEVDDINGQPIIDMMTGEEADTHFLSYRSEPSRLRPPVSHCVGEDCMFSSWAHGDPATPVLHAYVGDPVAIRLIHGGVKETHVFHLHQKQWRLNPKDPNSTIIDAISIGPQAEYTIEILFGAGSLNDCKRLIRRCMEKSLIL